MEVVVADAALELLPSLEDELFEGGVMLVTSLRTVVILLGETKFELELEVERLVVMISEVVVVADAAFSVVVGVEKTLLDGVEMLVKDGSGGSGGTSLVKSSSSSILSRRRS